MLGAVFFMMGLGGACALILSIASKVFYVYEDPRIAEVEGFLAGANCGGCGYAGCSAAAVAVVEGKASPSVCVIAGPDSAIAVAAVMGIDAGSAQTPVSENECLGGFRADDKYYYNGIDSCRALAMIYGGKRVCRVGCLGLGDCIEACAFDAVHMGPDGFPVVDEDKCVGCGACEKACPKTIINVRTMSERLLHFNEEDDALAPCQQTCPAEINIPKYISQIREGDYEGAVRTIRERNPLLLTCGRVCPHPCEDFLPKGYRRRRSGFHQSAEAVCRGLRNEQRQTYPRHLCSGNRQKGGGYWRWSCRINLRLFFKTAGTQCYHFRYDAKAGGNGSLWHT